MRVATLCLTFVVAACVASEGGSPSENAAEYRAGSPEGLPANAPARFGFGTEASEARIALWDIDVRPDGEGLPPGSGTVEQGREVFQTFCVECHGATGTEGPNDRLVGGSDWSVGVPPQKSIGNYWQYSTTLFDFIRRAMPQLTPGILSSDQTYAVVAYLLYLNDIVGEDAVMDANALPAITMPARDHFVLDDREGGSGSVR